MRQRWNRRQRLLAYTMLMLLAVLAAFAAGAALMAARVYKNLGKSAEIS